LLLDAAFKSLRFHGYSGFSILEGIAGYRGKQESDRTLFALPGEYFEINLGENLGEFFRDFISIFTRNSPQVISQNFTQG